MLRRRPPPLRAPTAAKRVTLDLSFIPAEAAALVIAHPHAALTGPDAQWLPTEVITAAGLQQAGFDPITVREAVALLAPPGPGEREPGVGIILRFVDTCPKEAILAKLPPMKEVETDGKSIHQAANARFPSVYFPDAQTLVLAPRRCSRK